MREIGHITLLQIQRSGLKVGNRLHTYYDPTPLLVVESLLVSPKGVIGITSDGKQVTDIHHIEHPNSHNHRGINGVSVGFTSHYRAMRKKFGEHLVNGCAGENILVEADSSFSAADLGNRLAIQSQQTGQFVYLTRFKVAAPCIEFSQFAANDGMPMPAEQLKEALQFLDGGQRGFYATVEDQSDQLSIQAGGKVFVVDID
jgi:hypothetical protein